jgi:hypothetical protein
MAEQAGETAQRAAEAMEQALLKATQSMERELARILRGGEEDFDRMARRFFERIVELALESVLDGAFGASSGGAGDVDRNSMNQATAAIARAARRGARFL